MEMELFCFTLACFVLQRYTCQTHGHSDEACVVEGLLGALDNGDMLEIVDLGLPGLDGLALHDGELLYEKRLPHVDGLDHIVDHAAALGDCALLAGLPGPLDGMCAVEGAWEGRVEVDDRNAGGLQRAKEGERENQHPAGTDHEVRLLSNDQLGQVCVEAVSGSLTLLRGLAWNALVVGLERVHGGRDAGIGCSCDSVGLRRRGEDSCDSAVQLPRTAPCGSID